MYMHDMPILLMKREISFAWKFFVVVVVVVANLTFRKGSFLF